MSRPADPPKVFGYLRISTDKQLNSFDRVLKQMRKKADELIAAGCEFGDVVKERESAVLVRWDKRPGFQSLMKQMQPGDHLIVEKLDRTDRDDLGMLNCLDWIERRQIILHSLMDGGQPIDLSDERTKICNHVEAITNMLEARKTAQRTKEGLDYRRVAGLACHGPLPLGMKCILLPLTAGQRKAYKAWVWDEHQCAILREIVRLRDDQGQSFTKIGLSLRERGFKTQEGSHWLIKIRGPAKWSSRNVSRAYYIIKAWQAEGIQIGGLPMVSTAASGPTQIPPSYVVLGPPVSVKT